MDTRKNKKISHQKCCHPGKGTHKTNKYCRVGAKYSNRRVAPQSKIQAEVDGPLKRRHEEKQHTPRVGIIQRVLVQHDEKRQPYSGNDGKVRKCSSYGATPPSGNTKWFDYKTNMEVQSRTKRQPLQCDIAQGPLRWFGHLLRSPMSHPAHAIYSFNPKAEGWLRHRGAPRTRWSDVLAKDLKQLGTTLLEAFNFAIDHSRWRSTIVARAVSTPSWQ